MGGESILHDRVRACRDVLRASAMIIDVKAFTLDADCWNRRAGYASNRP